MLNEYRHIFQSTQRQLLKTLPTLLKNRGYSNVKSNKDYILAKGNLPVMLVAHLDTVHQTLPTQIFFDKEQNIICSPQGIGADDRAGVVGILEITKKYKPYILFTTDEEVGCIGAKKVVKKIRKMPIHFIIELDRRGKDDAVFYNCDNPEFTNYICDFGFTFNYGSISDISYLCPAWGIAGVNLSIGYFNEHTKHEYLDFNILNNTISKVMNIMDSLPNKKFDYIEYKHSYNNFTYGYKNYKKSSKYNDYYNDYNLIDEDYNFNSYTSDELDKFGLYVCEYCGALCDEKDLLFVDEYICRDCWDDLLKYDKKNKQ